MCLPGDAWKKTLCSVNDAKRTKFLLCLIHCTKNDSKEVKKPKCKTWNQDASSGGCKTLTDTNFGKFFLFKMSLTILKVNFTESYITVWDKTGRGSGMGERGQGASYHLTCRFTVWASLIDFVLVTRYVSQHLAILGFAPPRVFFFKLQLTNQRHLIRYQRTKSWILGSSHNAKMDVVQQIG